VRKRNKVTLADMPHVSAGTPAGEWFRRYWRVVGTSRDHAGNVIQEPEISFRVAKQHELFAEHLNGLRDVVPLKELDQSGWVRAPGR
jgi:hypothetical protein